MSKLEPGMQVAISGSLFCPVAFRSTLATKYMYLPASSITGVPWIPTASWML
jgi:hypothetical protein